MKIKTAEAIGPALDWLVAKVNSIPLCLSPFAGSKQFVLVGQNGKPTTHRYEPSTSWAQGGPIIDRENIVFGFDDIAAPDKAHIARKPGFKTTHNEFYGPTKLIAAMRCYVASKLGDEVEIPEELK